MLTHVLLKLDCKKEMSSFEKKNLNLTVIREFLPVRFHITTLSAVLLDKCQPVITGSIGDIAMLPRVNIKVRVFLNDIRQFQL